MPVSSGEVFNFLTLAHYCWQLRERMKNLDDEHKHLKARAGELHLVFQELHRALEQFQNPRAASGDDYHVIFSDLIQSSHLTLCKIEPVLEKLERLKSLSGKKNAVQRGVRKLVIAFKNETKELSDEMRDQVVLLSPMVIRLNQLVLPLSP